MKLSNSLTLPNELACQTIALLGIRGSGKTNTAGVIVEESLDVGQQVCVIDPTDVWWGLRSSSSGKQSGYPVLVCGGEHGDIPLAETDGKVIADFIVQERMSCILSLRHLRKNAQRRFVTELTGELYHLKGKTANRNPLTIVIDEAPLFVPQSFTGDVAMCVGAIEDLVARGRASGFGIVLISQRAATINKNVLTQADTILTHRLTSPQDRKALKDWIEENATIEQVGEVLKSLAGLKNGEAWIWSPLQDVFQQIKVRLKRTFDSSFTPKMGETAVAPKKLAEIDLNSLKGKLAASIEQAKADDPKELKKRIKELEAKIKEEEETEEDGDAKWSDDQLQELLRSELIRFHKEFAGMVRSDYAAIDSFLIDVARKADALKKQCDETFQSISLMKVKPIPAELAGGRMSCPRDTRARMVPNKKNKEQSSPRSSKFNGNLSKAERNILRAMFWLQDEQATPAKVAFYSGYSVGSGSFNNTLSKLRTAGLIAGWEITADGIAAVPSTVEEKPTGAELREWLRPKLSKAENAILDALIEHYPERLSGETIAEASGYSAGSGSFNNALSKLRTLQAAEGYERDGGTKASDTLI